MSILAVSSTKLSTEDAPKLGRAMALRGRGGTDRLDDFRYLHSTRAELLRRLGRTDEARDA